MEAINRIVNEFLLPNIIQLYITTQSKYDDKDSIPIASATGFLLKTSSNFFLITAKHVFEGIKLTDVKFFVTNCTFIALTPADSLVSSAIGYDNLDIAVIRLHKGTAAHLMVNFRFVHVSQLLPKDKFEDYNSFLVIGFIAHQTSRVGRVINTNPFGYVTNKVSINNLEKLNLNAEENFFLRYNRRKQSFLNDDAKSIGPKDLRGLSGGPIWMVANAPGFHFLSLAGVLIEFVSKPTQAIVATKSYILQKMIQKLDY